DLPMEVATALAVSPDRRTAGQVRRIRDYFRSIDQESTRLAAAVLDGEMIANNRPPAPSSKALSIAANPKPRRTFVQVRGDFLTPGEEVRPGTPAFLPPLHARHAEAELDRSDLARWLVAPGNPLTARVAVNAVWQQL